MFEWLFKLGPNPAGIEEPEQISPVQVHGNSAVRSARTPSTTDDDNPGPLSHLPLPVPGPKLRGLSSVRTCRRLSSPYSSVFLNPGYRNH